MITKLFIHRHIVSFLPTAAFFLTYPCVLCRGRLKFPLLHSSKGFADSWRCRISQQLAVNYVNRNTLPVKAMVQNLTILIFQLLRRFDFLLICFFLSFFFYFAECAGPLGMENRSIPDYAITASSEVRKG